LSYLQETNETTQINQINLTNAMVSFNVNHISGNEHVEIIKLKHLGTPMKLLKHAKEFTRAYISKNEMNYNAKRIHTLDDLHLEAIFDAANKYLKEEEQKQQQEELQQEKQVFKRTHIRFLDNEEITTEVCEHLKKRTRSGSSY